MLLNMVEAAGLMATLLVVSSTIAQALRLPGWGRVVLLAAIGAWTGLQIVLASAGLLAGQIGPAPMIGIMAAIPMLAALVIAAASPSARTRLIGIPTETIMALNIGRLIGVGFVLLAAAGRMGGPFPYSAGWGDIITGADALLLTVLMTRGRVSGGAVALWNGIGTLDLVVALALGGITFGHGLGSGLLAAAPGGSEVASLPFALIPTVLVPLYLILHGVVFAQLRAGSVRAPSAA
jgi:hypothetical protein